MPAAEAPVCAGAFVLSQAPGLVLLAGGGRAGEECGEEAAELAVAACEAACGVVKDDEGRQIMHTYLRPPEGSGTAGAATRKAWHNRNLMKAPLRISMTLLVNI
jgi:hypothetical protein